MPRVVPTPQEFGGRMTPYPRNNQSTSGDMANTMGRWCALTFINDVSCTGHTGNPLVEGQVLTFSGGSWINSFASGSSSSNTFISSSNADATHSNVTFTYNNGSSFSMTNGYSLFSDRIVTGGTFNSNTDVITFRTNSGTTFGVSGFSVYDNYWSADTSNFIRVTGNTMGIKVGGDINTSGATHIKKNLFISGDTYATSDVFVDEFIYHKGDNDTYLKFKSTNDTVNLVAGGFSAIRFDKSSGKVVINNTNENVDFHVMGDNGVEILATDATNNRIGVNTTTPNHALTISGSVSATSSSYFNQEIGVSGATHIKKNLFVSGDVYTNQIRRGTNNSTNTKINLASNSRLEFYAGDSSNESLRIRNEGSIFDSNVYVSGNTQISGNTAIGGLSGKSLGSLSVVESFGNDYPTWRTDFGIGQGSGEIIKFGRYASTVSSPGMLVILKNASGTPAWHKTDARNPATYMIENMVGVTLDTYNGSDATKTATILIKGYVRIPSALWNGTAANNTSGKQVYASPDTNGEWTDEVTDFDTTNDVMRGMGYCLQYESTSPASYFVYFNPDGNYIKITA
tara:strand:+ start:1288 stop:2994 length:1707 start_codon:yes stop_codon:yes gene_type:complete